MSTMSIDLPRLDPMAETANERFKRGASNWTWFGVIIATVFHFLLFAFSPDMQAKGDYSASSTEFEAIDLPPEIHIPPPPQAIARPATPVFSAAAIDENITIAPTTFESNPVESLPPPPVPTAGDELASFEAFAPGRMVAPRLRNEGEIARALERFYPPLLRDARIGGTVSVLFWIDETGKVVQYQISESSGFPAFDEAAVKVADLMRFSPAMNRDQPIRVVVAMPITFRVAN